MFSILCFALNGKRRLELVLVGTQRDLQIKRKKKKKSQVKDKFLLSRQSIQLANERLSATMIECVFNNGKASHSSIYAYIISRSIQTFTKQTNFYEMFTWIIGYVHFRLRLLLRTCRMLDYIVLDISNHIIIFPSSTVFFSLVFVLFCCRLVWCCNCSNYLDVAFRWPPEHATQPQPLD